MCKKIITTIIILIIAVFLSARSLFAIEKAAAGDPRQPSEYEVKASVIYNVMKYVEWKGLSKNSDKEEYRINVSIIGKNPFGKILDEMKSLKIGNKNITVDYFDFKDLESREKRTEIQKSHVVFVCKSERKNYQKIIKALNGLCILTIGDEPGFVNQGGILAFDVESKRVVFDINFNNAKKAKIELNARVLKIARKVYK